MIRVNGAHFALSLLRTISKMQLKAPQNNQLKGWILGILGILTLSPDTLIIRLVDSDPWTFIAWRGAFMAIGMLFILGLSYRLQVFSKFFAVGWLGCLIAVIFSINNVFQRRSHISWFFEIVWCNKMKKYGLPGLGKSRNHENDTF